MAIEHREKFEMERLKFTLPEITAASLKLAQKINDQVFVPENPTYPEAMTTLALMLCDIIDDIAGKELAEEMSAAYGRVIEKITSNPPVKRAEPVRRGH